RISVVFSCPRISFSLFYNPTSATPLFTLSLHDALPISSLLLQLTFLRESHTMNDGHRKNDTKRLKYITLVHLPWSWIHLDQHIHFLHHRIPNAETHHLAFDMLILHLTMYDHF